MMECIFDLLYNHGMLFFLISIAQDAVLIAIQMCICNIHFHDKIRKFP